MLDVSLRQRRHFICSLSRIQLFVSNISSNNRPNLIQFGVRQESIWPLARLSAVRGLEHDNWRWPWLASCELRIATPADGAHICGRPTASRGACMGKKWLLQRNSSTELHTLTTWSAIARSLARSLELASNFAFIVSACRDTIWHTTSCPQYRCNNNRLNALWWEVHFH